MTYLRFTNPPRLDAFYPNKTWHAIGIAHGCDFEPDHLARLTGSRLDRIQYFFLKEINTSALKEIETLLENHEPVYLRLAVDVQVTVEDANHHYELAMKVRELYQGLIPSSEAGPLERCWIATGLHFDTRAISE